MTTNQPNSDTRQVSEGEAFHSTLFSRMTKSPDDPVLWLRQLIDNDRRTDQIIDATVGENRDEEGRLHVPKVIPVSEKKVFDKEQRGIGGKGYAGMAGLPAFLHLEKEMLIDPNEDLSHILSTIQTVGGTGAVFSGARFLKKHLGSREVFFSDPTWSNHISIFEEEGYRCASYPYYDRTSHQVDYKSMLDFLKNEAPPGAVIVLHGVCHNPTGSDFTAEQWDELASILLNRKLIPFLDIAYQGFKGGVREDMRPILAMAKQGVTCAVAHSYSKTLGVYGERLGSLTIISEHAAQVMENLKLISRHTISNPPIHGAKIAVVVLTEPALKSAWEIDLREESQRISSMRKLFAKQMSALSINDFNYVTNQHGMFSLLDLSRKHVIALRERHAVYILESGRINFAGLNHKNMDYLCHSIADVVQNCPL